MQNGYINRDLVSGEKKRMARVKKKKRKRKKASVERVIKVGALNREARDVIVTRDTTADEIRRQLDIGAARKVKASKNGRTNFREIKSSDIINGYKALLFIPAVSGGAKNR